MNIQHEESKKLNTELINVHMKMVEITRECIKLVFERLEIKYNMHKNPLLYVTILSKMQGELESIADIINDPDEDYKGILELLERVSEISIEEYNENYKSKE